MAFKQNLVQRLFNVCNNKFSDQTLRSCRISRSSCAAAQALLPPNPDRVAPDPGDDTFFRRFLQRRPLYLASSSALPENLRWSGGNLQEKLREMDIARERIRLDGLSPPVPVPVPEARSSARERELTVADAKKILRVSEIEMLKSKLRSSQKDHVSYDEFVQICVEGCSNREQGLDLAKALDDSGSVIVLGNVVFLKPEQVVKAIRGLMPATSPAAQEFQMKELEEMDRWKSAIDRKATKMVRRELWGGLGYLVVQTAAFMRLTFWELSWDVMEPICFYVTSMYFMAGYAFFLRTSKEPSFEGFFESRFSVKQKKLMKAQGFDLKKYDELKKSCYPDLQPWPRDDSSLEEASQGIANKTFT